MLQGSLHLFLRILLIPKLAAEITIIGLQIEVSLSAEVEDDDIFFFGLGTPFRLLDDYLDGMGSFRSRHNTFGLGKGHRCRNDRNLVVGCRHDDLLIIEQTHQGAMP